MMDLIGRVLGRYRVDAPLTGGVEQYRGHDQGLEREVLIRVLRLGPSEPASVVERLRDEARLAAGLRHSGILPLYDFGTADVDGETVAYVVTGFAGGSTLEERLEQAQAANRPVSLAEALRLVTSLAGALAYAHGRGVLHLDLKPADVILTEAGEPLLTGLGVAGALRPAAPEGDRAEETSPYQAPELAAGQPGNGRADVYSLGAILYRLLTNRLPPAPGASDAAIPEAEGRSAEAEQIALKALAPLPSDRYHSMGEMLGALDRVADATPASADQPAESKPKEATPRESIRRFLVQVVATLTAVSALIDKGLHAVGVLRNPLVGLVVVGAGLGAMVLSAGYVLARPTVFSRTQRRLAAIGLAVTVLAAAGWGGWTLYDITRPPKGLIVLISAFEQVPGSRSVDYARRIQTGLNQALSELEVEGVYVERTSEVYNEGDARERAAARKAAIVIYGWYDDAGVSPRFELVSAPQPYAPILKRTAVGLAGLDALEVRLDTELREMSYVAAAAIGLAYFADGQNDQALPFLDLALQSVPGETVLMGKDGIYLYKASCHFFRHEFSQAVAALEQSVALNGEFYEARHNLAIAYNANCNPEGALEQTKEALRLSPESAEAHLLHGFLLSSQGRWEEAAAAYEEAVRLGPDDAAGHSALAEAYTHLGHEEEAAEANQVAESLAQAKVQGQEEPKAMAALADAMLVEGRAEEATAQYERAIARGRQMGLRADRQAWLYRSLGMAHWEQEAWVEMAAAYQEAISLSPGLFTDHVSLGIAYQHQDMVAEAIAEYRRAVVLQPCDANSHDLLAGLLLQQGETDSALAEYRQAVEHDPDDFTAWHSIGSILDQQGHGAEAMDAYRRAVAAAEAYLERDPHDPNVAYLLGVLHFLLGDYGSALTVAERAVTLQPDAASHYLLGSLYFATADYMRAVAAYRAALEAGPPNAATAVGLAEAYRMEGDVDGAVTAYRQALELQDDPQVHASLGRLHEEVGELEPAAEEFRLALEGREPGDPTEASTRVSLARVLSRLCRTDEAVQVLQTGQPVDAAASTERTVLLAGLYEAQGRPDEADELYRTLLDAYPDLPGVHYLAAWFHFRQDELDEALAEMGRATERDPEFSLAWSALGQFHEAAGEPDAAGEAYETALASMPHNVSALLGLGGIALERGEATQALEWFQEALRRQPAFNAEVSDETNGTLVSCHLHLVLAYERLGRGEEAARERDTMLQLAEAACTEQPHSAQARFELGVALLASGRDSEAEAAFTEAIACDATMRGARDRVVVRLDRLRAH